MKDLSLFETSGYSMWPFLRPGVKLVIKKTSLEDLKVGDIILYQMDNRMPCHRLVKKVKNKERYFYHVRGDNSGFKSEVITEDMFFGKAIGIIKNGTIVNLIGKNQQFINRIIVIIAPLVSYVGRIVKPLYVKFVWKAD